MSRALLHALRARGIDVLTTTEAERRGRPDHQQLAFAAEHSRVVITKNIGDYVSLHRRWLAEGRSHAGIVAISRQQFPIAPYAAALAHLSGEFTPEEMANRLEFLRDWV